MTVDATKLLLVREIEEFLFHEARLLDQRRFEDWMALYTDDATYWVPAKPDQQSPIDTISIYYDDRRMMETRVKRLRPSSLITPGAPASRSRRCSARHRSRSSAETSR